MTWPYSPTLISTCKKNHHISAVFHNKLDWRSPRKRQVMALNTKNILPIQMNGEDLPTTDELTYLGSVVRNDGGPSKDIQNRLSKARSAFGDHNSMESKQNWESTRAVCFQPFCMVQNVGEWQKVTSRNYKCFTLLTLWTIIFIYTNLNKNLCLIGVILVFFVSSSL